MWIASKIILQYVAYVSHCVLGSVCKVTSNCAFNHNLWWRNQINGQLYWHMRYFLIQVFLAHCIRHSTLPWGRSYNDVYPGVVVTNGSWSISVLLGDDYSQHSFWLPCYTKLNLWWKIQSSSNKFLEELLSKSKYVFIFYSNPKC